MKYNWLATNKSCIHAWTPRTSSPDKGSQGLTYGDQLEPAAAFRASSERHVGCCERGVMAMAVLSSATIVSADEPIHLKIVGGLAGVSQYSAWRSPSGTIVSRCCQTGGSRRKSTHSTAAGCPARKCCSSSGWALCRTELPCSRSFQGTSLNSMRSICRPSIRTYSALRNTVGLYRRTCSRCFGRNSASSCLPSTRIRHR